MLKSIHLKLYYESTGRAGNASQGHAPAGILLHEAVCHLLTYVLYRIQYHTLQGPTLLLFLHGSLYC